MNSSRVTKLKAGKHLFPIFKCNQNISIIDNLMVVGLVTCLLNGSKAGVDLVLLQTSLLLLCKSSCSYASYSRWHLHKKSRQVCIKGRSPPASSGVELLILPAQVTYSNCWHSVGSWLAWYILDSILLFYGLFWIVKSAYRDLSFLLFNISIVG